MHTTSPPTEDQQPLVQITENPEKYPESLHRIRFKDCDPFGHLHNARYTDYIVEAREEHLLDHYGLDLQRHSERTGNGWVVRSSQQSFFRPVKWNNDVWIKTALLDASPGALRVEATMRSEDRSVIHAAIWMEFTYIALNRGMPIRHEPEMRQFFETIQVEKGFRLFMPDERIKLFRARKE